MASVSIITLSLLFLEKGGFKALKKTKYAAKSRKKIMQDSGRKNKKLKKTYD